MALPEQSSQLKTGSRPVQVIIKTYKPGEMVFEEGSKGRELFIIQEGKVGVYKVTPDGDVELARIDKGAVIGEMSLLDNMPRSATVKAIDLTRLMVINELTFQTALKAVPVWLTSIIKIVVSRLRDANKRVDQAVLRDKDRGLMSLMLLMLPSLKHEFSSTVALDYDLILVEGYYVCRLKKKEIVHILEGLAGRKIVTIAEDAGHKKHVCIPDLEVLGLFTEYLALKSQKKKFKEVDIPEQAVALLSNIVYVAQKSGAETDEGTTLAKSLLIKDLDPKNAGHLEKNLLDMKRMNLVSIMPTQTDETIIFRKETLARIKKIKEWLPRFEMETP
jgi:CRP/FNR family transcriptional regulator, cyclic AMP receptor protein